MDCLGLGMNKIYILVIPSGQLNVLVCTLAIQPIAELYSVQLHHEKGSLYSVVWEREYVVHRLSKVYLYASHKSIEISKQKVIKLRWDFLCQARRFFNESLVGSCKHFLWVYGLKQFISTILTTENKNINILPLVISHTTKCFSKNEYIYLIIVLKIICSGKSLNKTQSKIYRLAEIDRKNVSSLWVAANWLVKTLMTHNISPRSKCLNS